MDEPFSALDQNLREEMLALIRELRRDQKLTLLLATHRAQDAEELGAEVVEV
ncbi:MAG: hypothetical protein IBGAMO2_130066 [Arenicellales bacterium IbO2]|nr:MAG: hypothetical protein IBGAMO2_130066 [Arenicellales bacterium IbO2]